MLLNDTQAGRQENVLEPIAEDRSATHEALVLFICRCQPDSFLRCSDGEEEEQ